MKNIKFATLITLVSSILISCENLIDVDLPHDRIQKEDVYDDILTVNSALMNLYTNARENSMFSGDFNGLSYLFSLYTDELQIGEELKNDATREFYTNTLTSQNTSVASFWKQSYQHIYAINLFIEGVENSNALTKDNKNSFIGQALFLRTLYYQNLTVLFGDIPYTTTSNYLYNTKINKTSTNSILSSIEKDLIESISLLDYAYIHKEKIFPNKAAAELLLAKNYLLLKEYNKAEVLIKKIIDLPLYGIEQNINSVFKKTAKSTIWQFETNSPLTATKEATLFKYESIPPILGTAFCTPSLIKKFVATDLRRINWIKETTNNVQNWTFPYKYKNKVNNSDEYSIIFRIEEAYFLLAESLIYQDKIIEATKIINTIKKRATIAELPNNLTKEEIINEMLDESQREFFAEQGIRFFTLKRNNRLLNLSELKPNIRQKDLLLPYPESEISRNPNLLPNNYGY